MMQRSRRVCCAFARIFDRVLLPPPPLLLLSSYADLCLCAMLCYSRIIYANSNSIHPPISVLCACFIYCCR